MPTKPLPTQRYVLHRRQKIIKFLPLSPSRLQPLVLALANQISRLFFQACKGKCFPRKCIFHHYFGLTTVILRKQLKIFGAFFHQTRPNERRVKVERLRYVDMSKYIINIRSETRNKRRKEKETKTPS